MVAFRPVQVTPRVASASKTSTSSRRSTTLIRSCRVASSSSSRTGTGCWARIGPVSVPASTRCTLQPVTLTPYANASGTACAPGNAGNRAGWVLTNAAHEPGKKLRPKDFHESGRHDQIRIMGGGGFSDGSVPGVAIRVVAQPHGVRRHRRGGRDLDRRAVAVNADRDDPEPGSRRPRRPAEIAATNRYPRPALPAAPVHSGAHGAVAARLDNSGCLVGGFTLTVTGRARRGVVVSNEVVLRVLGSSG